MTARRKEPTLKPVVVYWVDSMAQPGWGDYARDTDLVCSTVGHLVESAESRIVVALSKSHNDYGDYLTIPRCSIKSIKHLVTARPKRPRKRRAASG